MATTTNFGWETPDDTDLVKDGAAAIRTALGGVDTSFVDLKGGTTGQVLSKASGTDLDFTWVAQDDSNAIQNAIVDAKGDLISATAADTPARLAVGANNTVLTADSSTATGLKWAAPTAAGTNWTLLNTGGTALTGADTITVSGISGVNQIMILVGGASSVNASAEIRVRLNGDTASNYKLAMSQWSAAASYSTNILNGQNLLGGINRIDIGYMSADASSTVSAYVMLDACNTAGIKSFISSGMGSPSGSSGHRSFVNGGFYDSVSTISSISVNSSSGNFDAGTVFVFTSA